MDEELTCELQCPVCLELLTWPIILPCSHVLCRDPCAERLFHNGFVRCPVCRDNSFVSGGITNLPRVIALEHIIERVQHRQTPALPAPDDSDVGAGWCGPDDIACQLCACEDTSGGEPPRKAVKSCLHCNASYCDRCLKMSHPGRAPFSEHKMVEPRKHTRPKELRCLDHDALMNIYCRDCQTLGCLLCADDAGIHAGHQVLSLRQTVEWLKSVLDDDLQKMELCMESMALSIAQFHTNMASLQRCVTERRSMIHEECDSLINEIENKKQFFLSDLEYEEKSKLASLSQQIEDRQQINATLHSLIYCAREVLQETDPVAFVQIAKSVVDKITKNSQKVTCGVLTPSPLPSPSLLNQKVVDFRKERAIIKDLSYLTVPNTPRIDVSKCFRSTSSVVLVLTSAEWDVNVIDGYTVYYSTSRDTKPDSWDLVDFKTPGETRKCGRGPQTDAAICLMHNNLECGMVYYFVVSAYNASGQSEMSEVTQCATLSASQTTLAVPQIVENQCRTYTYSIQLHSPSPLDDPPDSSISHYLLYREASVNKIWKSISLYGRVDHRVFGLEPNTLYDFVIMSCDKNSECQVSNMVTLQTERSAY